MSKTYTFTKEERLCNKRLIDQLYHSGSSFLCYPFKVSWFIATEATAISGAGFILRIKKAL